MESICIISASIWLELTLLVLGILALYEAGNFGIKGGDGVHNIGFAGYIDGCVTIPLPVLLTLDEIGEARPSILLVIVSISVNRLFPVDFGCWKCSFFCAFSTEPVCDNGIIIEDGEYSLGVVKGGMISCVVLSYDGVTVILVLIDKEIVKVWVTVVSDNVDWRFPVIVDSSDKCNEDFVAST